VLFVGFSIYPRFQSLKDQPSNNINEVKLLNPSKDHGVKLLFLVSLFHSCFLSFFLFSAFFLGSWGFIELASIMMVSVGGPAKSEIVFGRIPSWILTRSHLKFLRRCPIHEAHPMSFVLQEVPSRYLERAMMVVQNLTSLETFQCFSNQPAPMSILVWQAV